MKKTKHTKITRKNWSCFHCGFVGTKKEVGDHECPGERIVVDKNGNKYKIVT